MKRKDVLLLINEIFIDTLDNEGLIVKETTQATDVDEWDSLTHIMLVVAIEKYFNIQFTSKEIQSWSNVGEMINTISSKIVS